MSNDLPTLSRTVTLVDGHLQVQPPGDIAVSEASIINWTLATAGITDGFLSMGVAAPGFQWMGSPPPATVFNGPALGASSKLLTVTDLKGTDTGTWHYLLRASIDGREYQTANLGTTSTTSDPAIVNR